MSRESANIASENGHVEIVKYLHEMRVYASVEGANRAYRNGHMEVVKYLASEGCAANEYRYYACVT